MKTVLVAYHSSFSWGRDAAEAVEVAISLEHIAMLAYRSIMLRRSLENIKKPLLNKHYCRKHGKDAY